MSEYPLRFYEHSFTVEEVNGLKSECARLSNQFEQTYGKACMKPNWHVFRHIADGILSHGPMDGYHNFSMERLIGVIKKSNQSSPGRDNDENIPNSYKYGPFDTNDVHVQWPKRTKTLREDDRANLRVNYRENVQIKTSCVNVSTASPCTLLIFNQSFNTLNLHLYHTISQQQVKYKSCRGHGHLFATLMLVTEHHLNATKLNVFLLNV